MLARVENQRNRFRWSDYHGWTALIEIYTQSTSCFLATFDPSGGVLLVPAARSTAGKNGTPALKMHCLTSLIMPVSGRVREDRRSSLD